MARKTRDAVSGARALGHVTVAGRQTGWRAADSLIGWTHVFDLGTKVSPGKHRITLCVDNTRKIDLGTFVSALYGGVNGNLNGIVGRIELRATDPVWIQDVQVFPDLKKSTVRIKIQIGNATGKPGRGTITTLLRNQGTQDPSERGGKLAKQTFNGRKPAAGLNWKLPSGQELRLWDEFSPNLYSLTLSFERQRIARVKCTSISACGISRPPERSSP